MSRLCGRPTLVCAVVISLVTVALAGTPTISISPTGLVTLGADASVQVSGSGFPASTTLVVWFDTNGNGQLDDGEPGAALGSSGAGDFSNVRLVLRAIPAGVHQIQAGVCPNTTPPPSASPAAGLCLGTTGVTSQSFTLNYSVTPVKFGSGTTVTVTGYGFAPHTNLQVWFDANNNNMQDAAETPASVTSDGNGGFSTTLLVKNGPGTYGVQAGPFTTPAILGNNVAASIPVEISTCQFQECFIDDADTICLLGNSPSDTGALFTDCKQIDSNYTKPVPATQGNNPPGGYDFTNRGPRFLGAAVLAAALNDLAPPPTGCVAINAALADAQYKYGNDVPEGGFDLFKPGNLADITCGGAFGVVPPADLATYMAAEALAGNTVPDAALILGAVGTLVAIPGGGPAAQPFVAEAAVAAAVACGHVDYYCDGADITATILSDPTNNKFNPADLQNQLVPILFFQPPSKAIPTPDPCRDVNGNCWGGTIGWGQVACTELASPVDSNGNGVCEQPGQNNDYPQLPVPGSAGPDNSNAPVKCATGKVVGLSIGYDGDISFDVNDPSILPLTNYHNFLPGPGGTDPPNGIDVEIPLINPTKDPNLLLSTDANLHAVLAQLRPGMEVNVCGHWVADMHMLWNELHPVTSLTLEPEFTLAASPADVTLQAGEAASTSITTTLNSGPSSAVTLTVLSGLPNGVTPTFSASSVTPMQGVPATSTLTIPNLSPGDYSVTIQGQSGAVTRILTVNFHVYDYTLAATPSDDTVLRGGSTVYQVTATLAPNSSTTNLPTVMLGSQGLPGDATLTFGTAGLALAGGGGTATTLTVATAASGSLGDFTFTVSGTNPSNTVRTSNTANLHLYDFTVAAIPSTLQVLTTGSNTYQIQVALTPQSSVQGLPALALSVAGLPANTGGIFSPGNGTAFFASTLTITTANAASSPGLTLTMTGADSRSPEGGSRSVNATLVILTPAQALVQLIQQVPSLGLNNGQSNSLITKMQQAIASLTSKPPGNPAACNQLDALVNEINGYVTSGQLTQAQANSILGGPLGIYAIEAAIPCR